MGQKIKRICICLLYTSHPEVQAAKGIGYKELFPYFKGEQSLEEASEILKRNTRRFAKRQLTWFRNRMEVTFYAISAPHFKEQRSEERRVGKEC